MQSARLLVRIIHQLNKTPVIRPTSQYDPCSEAKSTATIQNDCGVYVPSGILTKSLAISQRISQPRQNNSSRIGTLTTLASVRKTMNVMLLLTPAGRELVGTPTMLLVNNQLCRYAGHNTSGPT